MRGILTIAIACLTTSTHADVLRVDPSAPNGGNGSSWPRAFNSLTDALAAAASGDELWVVQGTYVPIAPAGRDATFTVPLGVQVYGGFEGGETSRTQRDPQDNVTELSGAGTLYTIVTIAGDNAAVDGFTISKGLADGVGAPARARGAAVFADGVAVVLRNNIFLQHESTSDGAAVQLSGAAGASSVIEDCVFTDITGEHAIEARANSIIRDCEIVNNTSGAISLRGSGIYSIIGCRIDNNAGADTIVVATESGAFTEIDGCIIEDNNASVGGAVRYAIGGDHQIRNSFIRGNTGIITSLASGGVIDNLTNANDSISIESTLFSGNTGGEGAAIRKSGPAQLSVIGSTIVGNSAVGFGGGISVVDGSAGLWNTIIYNNTSSAGTNDERVSVFGPIGGDIVADRCIIQYLGMATFPLVDPTDSSAADPMFVDADGPNNTFGDADDNVRLMPGSPAIDAGNNLFVGPFVFADIYNQPRFRDDTGTPDTGVDGGLPPIVDIGAAEFQGTTPGSCLADTNGDGAVTPADFNAWIIAFNSQSAACDQNGDGLCTPADFNAWIINFNTGC